MKHTPQEIATTAANIRQLFLDAVAALNDPAILEAVIRFALNHPEIMWEPVALAACALNAKRERDKATGAVRTSLPGEITLLPAPPPGSDSTERGVSLPNPPFFI